MWDWGVGFLKIRFEKKEKEEFNLLMRGGGGWGMKNRVGGGFLFEGLGNVVGVWRRRGDWWGGVYWRGWGVVGGG